MPSNVELTKSLVELGVDKSELTDKKNPELVSMLKDFKADAEEKAMGEASAADVLAHLEAEELKAEETRKLREELGKFGTAEVVFESNTNEELARLLKNLQDEVDLTDKAVEAEKAEAEKAEAEKAEAEKAEAEKAEAEKAEAEKAEAEKAEGLKATAEFEAKTAAVEVAGLEFAMAQGKAINTSRGVLCDGDEISAKDFVDGEKTLKAFVASGHIIKLIILKD